MIPLWMLGMLFLAWCMVSCTPSCKPSVDEMNASAYSFHYKDLDSTQVYAGKALRLAMAEGYSAGRVEAMNHLAFVALAKMDYHQAYLLLDSVSHLTDNQVELLISDVQMMRLCQRESRNKEFYDYHEQALQRMHRIEEELSLLDEHLRDRMTYALSEFDIVTSTYYYYVGLERKSIEALEHINPDGEVRKDTAQLLAYYYNIGAGGILTQGTPEEIRQGEFDYLMRCYLLAHRQGYIFWEANSLQAISEHLQEAEPRQHLIDNNLPAMKFINVDQVADSLLAGNLAERSLKLFEAFGDAYQVAGAYRTLAQCYWHICDYRSAIVCLEAALHKNPAIGQAPDLVASICEQLCVAYSAIDDKPQSDHYRNRYLDLQEETRQDRYLEARAGQLDKSLAQLNMMIVAVVGMILALIVLLVVLTWLRRHDRGHHVLQSLTAPLLEWKQRNEEHIAQLHDRYEEMGEQRAESVLHLQENKRRHVE